MRSEGSGELASWLDAAVGVSSRSAREERFQGSLATLREHHLDGPSNISEKSLLLVFTKADLLFIPRSRDDYKELIADYTFPQRWRLTADELTGEFEKVRERFSVVPQFEITPKAFANFSPAVGA